MKIFLIVPFRGRYEDVFEIVKSVAITSGHSVSRADDFQGIGGKTIRQQAEAEIAACDIIIADVTKYDDIKIGSNNVRSEFAYAKSLGKPIIPICDRETELSFDLSDFQAILYDRLRLQETLVKPLANYLNKTKPKEFLLKKTIDTKGSRKKSTIFISYSHIDIAYLERLKVHLKPFEKNGQIDLWADTNIKAGQKWKERINEALNNSVIAILLVSADFLASDFIVDNELPPILKAAEEKGKVILSIIVKPCRFTSNESLSEFQAVNDPKNPLSKLNENDREEVYVKVAERIDNLVK